MSDPDPPYDPLEAAVTKQAVEASYDRFPDHEVKKYLLDVVAEIDSILSATNVAGKKSAEPNTPTLQVLAERLAKGYHSPSYGLPDKSVPPGNRNMLCTKTKDPMSRPLGDFEDLYYSLLATIKEMHSGVMLRMKNKFTKPDKLVLPEKGYTMKSLATWLYEQWGLVNEPAFVRALNDAVQVGYEYGLQFEELSGEPKTSRMREQQANIAQEIGLSYIGNLPPAMINGKLNEKYRLLLKAQAVAPINPKRQVKKVRMRKKSSASLKNQSSAKDRQHGNEQVEQQPQGAVQVQPQTYAMDTGDFLPCNEREGEHPDLCQQQLRVEHNNQVESPVQRDQSPEEEYAPPYGFINWACPVATEQDEDVHSYIQSDQDVTMAIAQYEDIADTAMDLDPNDFPSDEHLGTAESQYNLQVHADHQSHFYQGLQNFENELNGWPTGTVQGRFMPDMNGDPVIQQQVSIYTNWANEMLRERDIQDQSAVPSMQPHPGEVPATFGDPGGQSGASSTKFGAYGGHPGAFPAGDHGGQPGASPGLAVDPGGQANAYPGMVGDHGGHPGAYPVNFGDPDGQPGASSIKFGEHGGHLGVKFDDHGGQPCASPGMVVDPGGQATLSPGMFGYHGGWEAGDMSYMM